MLDLRHGTVVRTLIPKIAEGIFNVICKFNEGPFRQRFLLLLLFWYICHAAILETFSQSTPPPQRPFCIPSLDERVRAVLPQWSEDAARFPCCRRRDDRQLQGTLRPQAGITGGWKAFLTRNTTYHYFSSLESTTDGNSVVLGMVDGNLTVLTIADPKKPHMKQYLKELPSRYNC